MYRPLSEYSVSMVLCHIGEWILSVEVRSVCVVIWTQCTHGRIRQGMVRCISCWRLMNFHDCCNCTAFLDLKKHHVIAVSVVAVSVMKSAREVCNVMPLTYHFLFGPFMESLLQHVDVTYVNMLADQYRPSLTSNITEYHENLMLRSGLFCRWWTNKRDSIISMRFVFLLQEMAKSWDERHLLRESGSFHENSHHVRTFQSLFLFG